MFSVEGTASSEAEPSDTLCAEVFYSGHVQGVGFRYTVSQMAERFTVGGYVENLHDGRVHLIAEGSQEEVEGFLAAIAERLDSNIESVEQSRVPAASQQEKFTAFSIRR